MTSIMSFDTMSISIMSFDTMSNSFMTVSPMGNSNIGKTSVGRLTGSKSPVSRLTDSKLVSQGGVPLQPTLPSRYPHTKMVESESTGVQCPRAQTEAALRPDGANLPELVH